MRLILTALVALVVGALSTVTSHVRVPSAGATPATTTAGHVSCHARSGGQLPDPACTPGAVNPAVTPATIGQTICVRGWTRTVRPPSSVTRREKLVSMRQYGDRGSTSAYEYDHLIPLELGGATNSPRNLWPEPGRTPNRKDRLENGLRRLVCAGSLGLRSAQRQIAANWLAAYGRYLG